MVSAHQPTCRAGKEVTMSKENEEQIEIELTVTDEDGRIIDLEALDRESEKLEKEVKSLQELEDRYLKTRNQVEELWKETKEQGFPQKLRDDLWRLSNQERLEYSAVIRFYESTGKTYRFVKEVPGYKRAIMLLEHEKRLKMLSTYPCSIDMKLTGWNTHSIK